MVVDEPQKMIP